MKLQLDRLTDSPSPHTFEGDSGWWRAVMRPERGLPEALAEPVHFSLRAHRLGEDVYLEGTASGALELECGRCLKRYRHALREPFRLVLEPAGDRTPADPEAAEALSRTGTCLGEDLEAGWFRGETIDLGAFFMELVSLALPVQPLCREECPGLCPRCGTDLGVAPCDCEPEKPSSPFAVLASLRRESNGGSN